MQKKQLSQDSLLNIKNTLNPYLLPIQVVSLKAQKIRSQSQGKKYQRSQNINLPPTNISIFQENDTLQPKKRNLKILRIPPGRSKSMLDLSQIQNSVNIMKINTTKQDKSSDTKKSFSSLSKENSLTNRNLSPSPLRSMTREREHTPNPINVYMSEEEVEKTIIKNNSFQPNSLKTVKWTKNVLGSNTVLVQKRQNKRNLESSIALRGVFETSYEYKGPGNTKAKGIYTLLTNQVPRVNLTFQQGQDKIEQSILENDAMSKVGLFDIPKTNNIYQMKFFNKRPTYSRLKSETIEKKNFFDSAYVKNEYVPIMQTLKNKP